MKILGDKFVKKMNLAVCLFSTSLFLTACGNDEKKYSSEEVAEIVNKAVAEALQQNSGQEETEVGIQEDLVMGDQPTDTYENEVMGDQPTDPYENEVVRGSFTRNDISEDKFLTEESFTKDGRYKEYDLYSPINHNGLLYNVTSIEIIKYLESDFTSNLVRAGEGKSYIIMHLTGQNVGDREKNIDVHTFTPQLKVYDENDNFVGRDINNLNTSAVVNAYLEQYGVQLDPFTKVERLDNFHYILGFTVEDELLKPGMKLVLEERTSFGQRLEEYTAAVYQFENDFILPEPVEK